MKRKACGLILLLSVIVSVFFSGCKWLEKWFEGYETTDINKYGELGEKGDREIREYHDAIMPEKIEEFFEVKKYSANWYEPLGYYEEYLEVVIESESKYQEYVEDLIEDKETMEFFYDENFIECFFKDWITLDDESEGSWDIYTAQIQKILFDDGTNTIIFVALARTSASGPVESNGFYYFSRFNIDARTYYNGERCANHWLKTNVK